MPAVNVEVKWLRQHARFEMAVYVPTEYREFDPDAPIPPVDWADVETFWVLFDVGRRERGVLRERTGQFLPWPEDDVSHLTFAATTA